MTRVSTRSRLLIGVLAATAVVGFSGCGSDATSSTQSTAPVAGAVPPPTGGATFTDPDGVYRMAVASAWTDRKGDAQTWFINFDRDTFNDSVNVTDEVTTKDVTIDEYLETSIANGPKVLKEFGLISRDIVTLPSGSKAGRLTFSAVAGAASTKVRFLSFTVLRGRQAVTATLTAADGTFDSRVAEAEPFLKTLEVLKG